MGYGQSDGAEADDLYWDRRLDDDDGEWPACAECGDPTDDEHGSIHAACGQFYCPGECGRVVTVPMLACPGCAAWVADEDEAERAEARQIEDDRATPPRKEAP